VFVLLTYLFTKGGTHLSNDSPHGALVRQGFFVWPCHGFSKQLCLQDVKGAMATKGKFGGTVPGKYLSLGGVS
jgi:hypothetical protein